MPQTLLEGCTPAQQDAIAAGSACMRRGEFFAAHEHFERAWRSADGRARLAFHGLVQLAASHHQLTLGRGRAAVRTWLKARAKLDAAGVLTPALDVAMQALHARAALSADGPREVDPAQLGPAQRFPMLDADTLHTPSA